MGDKNYVLSELEPNNELGMLKTSAKNKTYVENN